MGAGVLKRAGLLLGALLLCAPAFAQDRIWVGTIERLQVKEPRADAKDPAPVIEVEIVEDQTDGKFGPYDIEKASAWQPLDKPKIGARVTLDGVFRGDFAQFKLNCKGPLLQRVSVEATKSSLQKPNLQMTPSGKQLEHAQIVIEASVPILVNTTIIKNLGDQRIVLALKIIEQKQLRDSSELTNSIEFSTENFDRPVTRLLNNGLSARQKKFLERTWRALDQRDPDDYVSAIYPVRYADPNRLAGFARARLSQIGRLDVDQDRSNLLITDRARFVRGILETLVSLDRRPPQVTVVAQIVEINRSSGSRIGVDFTYMSGKSGPGLTSGSYKSSGILNQSAILSGVYQNFSEGVLERFAADINLLAERKLARIAAQPVLRVLNNSRGTFNSGERLPFFLPNSISEGNNFSNFRSDIDNNRTPGAKVLESGAPLVTEDQRRARENRSGGDRRVNSGVTTVRTGVRLVLTPTLRNSKQAILNINASYNELNGYAQPFGNPIISERSVDTRIRVRHGETVVIAGLYRQTEIKQSAGLPWLSRVPIFGNAFKSERKSKETYDIVFILTTFIQHE